MATPLCVSYFSGLLSTVDKSFTSRVATLEFVVLTVGGLIKQFATAWSQGTIVRGCVTKEIPLS